MHEEALFRDLRRKLLEAGETPGLRRVTRVRIWIGALSHVGEPRLREEWPRLTAGTRAEGAALVVTLSDDLTDPRSQGVVLESLDVDAEPSG
jgi:hydrogenase nickel incorporation protein HypA/HybF